MALTFKAVKHDTELMFDRIDDERERAIHELLAVYQARIVDNVAVYAALNNLATVQADYDAAALELHRLEHIERVTDAIRDPFPPHIASKLRAAGIDDESQRELANDILSDEDEHAPMQTTAYYPQDDTRVPLTPMERGILMHKIIEGKFDNDPVGRARAMHEIIEDVGNSSLADLLGDDDYEASDKPWPETTGFSLPDLLEAMKEDERPSLHGDGHVGPIYEFDITPHGLAFKAARDMLNEMLRRK